MSSPSGQVYKIILGSPANVRPFTNVIRVQSSNPRFSQDRRTGYYFLPTGLYRRIFDKIHNFLRIHPESLIITSFQVGDVFCIF